MPGTPTPDSNAVKRADEMFYQLHPDRRGKPLTASEGDARLREEWLRLYTRSGGVVTPRVAAGTRRTTLQACLRSAKKLREVYVYSATGNEPYGHVGLIIQQPDGSYKRYSQQAENSNLQGIDRWQYFAWWQPARVHQRMFAKGTKIKSMAPGGQAIRIPTEHPDQVQAEVDKYIARGSQYHVITNNCADFVNDTINAAEDVSVPDATIPKDYFRQLTEIYPNCQAD